MVRYFVYSYAIYENYQITRDNRVFGAPKYGGDHLATKVEKFSPGDIIGIRDGTVQNAENFTEAAMDMPALKNLETAMLQMTIEKARNSYAAQGFDPKTFKPSVQSSSVYMTVEGKKLAIVKATMNDQVRAIWIMGFRRDQFLRVTCLRSSNHDIPIFSGECGSKLMEAFSISFKRQ